MNKPTDDIYTPRLILRLISREVISYCLEKKLERAEHLLKVKIPLEMLDHPSSLRYSLKQFKEEKDYLPWAARAIIIPEENQMIGIFRFHSKPNPDYLKEYATNAVEFGYRIFEAYRAKGYATEAVAAVMNWAEVVFEIKNFVASISPTNEASLKIISKFKFKKITEVMDEVDGLEYIFLRNAGEE